MNAALVKKAAIFSLVTFSLVTFSLAALIATPALARQDVRRMSCAQATALVHNSGSIVLTLTQNTYDKIVRNRSFCSYGENSRWLYTPTLDDPKCRIGQQCFIDYNGPGDGEWK